MRAVAHQLRLPPIDRERYARDHGCRLDVATPLRGNGQVALSETIGREPPRRRRRLSPWAVASIAVVTAVALASIALHYRAQAQHAARRAAHRVVQLSFPPPPPLQMGTQVHRVHAGGLAMTVQFTSTVDESRRRNHGQVQVAATVTGAPAGQHLRLEGGDCTTGADRIWATGVTDGAGTAYLAGRIWRLSSSHEYYLDLAPWRVARRLPGLDGIWLGGLIQPFHAGNAPCL